MADLRCLGQTPVLHRGDRFLEEAVRDRRRGSDVVVAELRDVLELRVELLAVRVKRRHVVEVLRHHPIELGPVGVAEGDGSFGLGRLDRSDRLRRLEGQGAWRRPGRGRCLLSLLG